MKRCKGFAALHIFFESARRRSMSHRLIRTMAARKRFPSDTASARSAVRWTGHRSVALAVPLPAFVEANDERRQTFTLLWPIELRLGSPHRISLMGNSKAYSDRFDSLMQDVRNLDALHPAVKGTPGRPPGDTGPLLRSMVVLLHTAWENWP